MKTIRQAKKGRKSLILLVINLFLVGLLVYGGQRILAMIRENDFQEKIAEAIATEERQHAADTEQQKGMIGSHYVQAFYSRIQDQVIPAIREAVLADSQTIQDDQSTDGTKTSLTFYYSEDRESSLAHIKEFMVFRKDYQLADRTVKADQARQIAATYIKEDGSVLSLDQLFQDPAVTKDSFLTEMGGQLGFRQVDETEKNEILSIFQNLDLSQWAYRYENSHFSIRLPKEVQGSWDLDLPLSSFYSEIKPEFLQGADLEGYQSYEEKRHEKVVALTFDDGPDPRTTPQALDILKKYKAKATFFMVGQNVAGNEALIQRVKDEGHQIGIHTWDHPVLTKLPLDQAKSQILDTQSALYKAVGIKPTITRPPYGAINLSIQNSVDQSFIMWNVDSLDWKNRNTEAILAQIKASTKPGSIILMHDIHQTTIDALPAVLDYLKKEGYSFVTVDELLQGQLQPHQIYYGRD